MPTIESASTYGKLRPKKVAFVTIVLLCFLNNAFSQQDSSGRVPAFLPLRIMNFETAVLNKNVQLLWTVSNLEEAKAFEIERAEEGSIYKKVGSKLAGSRSTGFGYEFVDALPKPLVKLSYRIKLIPKEGGALYSIVQTVRISGDALQCKLKQNPVRNAVEVEVVSTQVANLQTSVYTAYGQKIKSETTKLSAGVNLLSFSIQNLLPGLHRLVLESGSERAVLSFVKE